jgi:hypothetical protein
VAFRLLRFQRLEGPIPALGPHALRAGWISVAHLPCDVAEDALGVDVRHLLRRAEAVVFVLFREEREVFKPGRSVPALGNKTPRAACKTAKGRLRVARMIRSMPDMLAPGASIPPPREELLRELGIEA